ncbi:terminase large subunit [Aquamicrobium phage P14]|uniref:Putative terminase large subunit n=1 Tax=Aquamicrobium phage P14 TaxID=1927013 RepID=A0A1L5C079_9CAUD|nr:terminase large subunit [Aquamicrobium phage P14]APL99505.1 putative terminase large subunit [Aquamicrobium phage P14]
MAGPENQEHKLVRQRQLEAVAAAYPEFVDFLEEVMLELGYPTSWLQKDIAHFLQHGPHFLMVQAQRGQAKSTITTAFAVWTLIHNPRSRILVVSAGGDTANEISTLIVRLIMNMDILECLRPDKSAGDRTSTESFDVHHSLKGVDKSPSVASVGITGTLQGKRATLLIADDIESTKNSQTAGMREYILDLSRDFSSQCVDEHSRIIYLGTPQSQDSIYNTLPGRGFEVRIWPGRYPTEKQQERYGDALAPSIVERMRKNPGLRKGGGPLGEDGQPTDPSYIGEDVLQKKLRDQGPSKFMLNHMLDTSVADALRYPLKTEHIVVERLVARSLPVTVQRAYGSKPLPFTSHTVSFSLVQGVFSQEVKAPEGIIMYVDPAGGGANGDETGYAVSAFLNGNVFILACGGLPGGYGEENLLALASIAMRWQVNKVIIEKNFGHGAFKAVWTPILLKLYTCAVEDDYVTGQKERRICDTLEPVIGRGALVFSEAIIEEDRECCARYSPEHRATYSLFHQINKMTREPKCVKHDDRIDALEGSVRYWQAQLAIDQDKALEEDETAKRLAFLQNPLGHPMAPTSSNLFNKYRR